MAAVLIAAAPPAFAANVPVTLSPNAGPVNAATSVTATATGFLATSTTAAMIDVRFVTATTCPTTNGTATTASIPATGVTRNSDDSVTFTTPNPLGTAPATYRVCIYGVTTGTPGTTAPLIGNASAATTAFRTYLPGTLSATTGPSAGGNTITLSGTGIIGTVTTLGATFTGGECRGTYTTSGTSFASAGVVKNSADQATITAPSTATAAGGPYRVCLYNGTTTGTSVLLAAGSATYQPSYPQAILSASTGKNGGGNTVTATLPGAFAGLTPGVVFVNDAGACPAAYGSPTAGTVATVPSKTDDTLTITVPTGVLAPNGYNVCIYGGSTALSSQIGIGNATYVPTLPDVSLSPESGSTATATTITATSSATANFLLGVTSPGAVFTKSACPSTYTTTGTQAATSVIRISNNKAAITVPTSVVYTPADGATTAWNACIYSNSTSGPLVATATYRVGATLAVTSISPASGPAQGGSSVTVVGTGFTPGLTASVGGAPIEDIIVASDGLSFTGNTTPRGAGTGLTVTVKTDAGSKSLTNAYAYTFGVTVTPNTAPSGAAVTLDVLGAGFESIGTFGTGNTADAHVYLVRGGAGAATAYNPLETGAGNGIKTVPQVQECTSVLVISDLELLCTLDLSNSLTNATPPVPTGTPVPEGTYTVTVVESGVAADAPTVATISRSLITSGSTFTVAPY